MDAEKRVALYSQMQQMMVDEAPALWLYQQDTLYAYNSKKVQNWTARNRRSRPHGRRLRGRLSDLLLN